MIDAHAIELLLARIKNAERNLATDKSPYLRGYWTGAIAAYYIAMDIMGDASTHKDERLDDTAANKGAHPSLNSPTTLNEAVRNSGVQRMDCHNRYV